MQKVPCVFRKGRSLRDMIIERGGIKEGTELAKSLGFDVLKKDKMYTTKDTAFDNEAELIEWLAEEGLIVGVQEGEDYSATERRWEDVQRLIDNAENTYTVRESLINQERETALANQAHVQEIVDELLKDNELGLKDINDLDDLLSKIVSRKDDVDITKVNSNAIKYLNERVKGLNKEIKALERNKNKEFKNKREEQYLAQEFSHLTDKVGEYFSHTTNIVKTKPMKELYDLLGIEYTEGKKLTK